MSATDHPIATRAWRVAVLLAPLLNATAAVGQQASASPSLPPSGVAFTTPRIDALPQPLTSALPDLSNIAKGFPSSGETGLRAGPGLFVFVSLSMPEATLHRLMNQAASSGASVLLRGLVNGSLRDTVAQIQKFVGKREVGVVIDPQAFDRYGVRKVPTFVLSRDAARPVSCASGTCPPPVDFVSVAGDVSLDYALIQMRHAAPGFAPEIAPFFTRLKH